MFDSQTKRFCSSVLDALPELSSNMMQGWIQNPRGLQKALREALSSPLLVITKFSVPVYRDDTFDSLIAAGSYDWKDNWIAADRFPVRSAPFGDRRLVLLHFGRPMSSEAAIAEAAKQGLERPTYEDCLRFGAQHPEVQREFPIVFLHEPVRDEDGYPRVLYLDGNDLKRELLCRWFVTGGGSDDHFAFIRPPTVKP